MNWRSSKDLKKILVNNFLKIFKIAYQNLFKIFSYKNLNKVLRENSAKIFRVMWSRENRRTFFIILLLKFQFRIANFRLPNSSFNPNSTFSNYMYQQLCNSKFAISYSKIVNFTEFLLCYLAKLLIYFLITKPNFN